MKKLSVCILFGGMSPEHEVSLRSAESVLNHIDESKYNLFPVGITKEGDWILYGGKDYSKLVTGEWRSCPDNRRATISPVRGQGLLSFEGDCVVRERIDVVFPVLHGENGEDGAMQGLLQMAGIPYVGPHIAASAVAMDKSLTKLVADQAGVPQAAWQLVRAGELENHMENTLDLLENRFRYPMFVKPAGTGSSVGVSKVGDRDALRSGLRYAGKYDKKILVEEFINGKEIEVAVMGCVVNGPGEARGADVGIAGGNGEGLIFRKGEIVRKVPEADLVNELFQEIDQILEERKHASK